MFIDYTMRNKQFPPKARNISRLTSFRLLINVLYVRTYYDRAKTPQNVNILQFHDHIWNHHERHKRTNMPGIGSLIREIDIKCKRIYEKAKLLLLSKTNARILGVNYVNRIIAM